MGITLRVLAPERLKPGREYRDRIDEAVEMLTKQWNATRRKLGTDNVSGSGACSGWRLNDMDRGEKESLHAALYLVLRAVSDLSEVEGF